MTGENCIADMIKRVLSLFVLITVMLTGCNVQKEDIEPSVFIDGYSFDDLSSYAYLSEEVTVDFSDYEKFLYEDLCYEPEDVTDSCDYNFAALSALCYDVDNSKVIYSRNVYNKVFPASTTKLLTALTAVRHGDLNKIYTIEEDNCGITVAGAQLCGFKAGDTLSLKDLLYCLLIYSGNDAGVAIANAVSGSVDAFVDLMNSEAALIGAKDTNFRNPHGLHDIYHYTTAYDMYLILNECLKYPELKEIISCNGTDVYVSAADGTTREMHMEPTNLYFLGKYRPPVGINVFGGKTGVTSAAGYCLILYSENADAHGYITALFGCTSYENLYTEMNVLLELCNR